MRLLKFGALSCALSVSACTLDIDFVGEGTVFTEDQSIFCTQSCLKRSISSLKKVTLQATPAAGYAFYGFVGHSKFKFLDFPEETLYGTYPETGLYEYGFGVVPAYEGLFQAFMLHHRSYHRRCWIPRLASLFALATSYVTLAPFKSVCWSISHGIVTGSAA